MTESNRPHRCEARMRREVRKIVSVVFFSDVAGSTVLAEQLDPESLRDTMAALNRELGRELEVTLPVRTGVNPGLVLAGDEHRAATHPRGGRGRLGHAGHSHSGRAGRLSGGISSPDSRYWYQGGGSGLLRKTAQETRDT